MSSNDLVIVGYGIAADLKRLEELKISFVLPLNPLNLCSYQSNAND